MIFIYIVILAAVILIAASFFVLGEKAAEKSSVVKTNNPPIVHSSLSQAQIEKVTDAILSSQFIKDVPEDNPVSLTFYTFQNGERVWQNSFLIGNNQILQSGTPGVSITMDSKYIFELNSTNLCDIIKEANKNGDLGFASNYSTSTLFLKYITLLKDQSCFGQ